MSYDLVPHSPIGCLELKRHNLCTASLTSYIVAFNSATIAAGSVMTKDVPPYSVVGGVPAKEISRKCSEEEAAAMSQIAWWNWDDDVIEQRVQDFQLSIPDFIRKYR